MKKLAVLIAVLICSTELSAQVDSVYYDFNSLTVGNLNNQDYWKTIQQTNGTADFTADYTAGGVVSPDGTMAVYYNAGGPGVGRTATRKASPNFNFNFQTGGVQELEIQMFRNYWGMFIGAGFDADHDGYIAPGLATEPNDGGIYLNIASYDSINSNKVVLPNGTSIPFVANNSGWSGYKLVLDFTANSGQGAVALFCKPHCTGPWIAISQVQGVNMHLTPGSGDKYDYHAWDGIFFHSQGAVGAFDNLKIRKPNTGGLLFQFINFPVIGNKLTSTPPFVISATSISLLPVSFSVASGPATVNGDTITLTGQPGSVSIRASQAGDATWGPAPDVFANFEVVDPTAYSASLIIRRPADNSKVYMPQLGTVMLVASSTVLHPEVLSVQSLNFVINGTTYPAHDWGTGYFTANWNPPSYGNYPMTVNATITGGNVSTQTVNFEVSPTPVNTTVTAFDSIWISPSAQTATGSFVFPSYVGAFEPVKIRLDISCPAGGCEAYDRVGNLEVRGPTGEWIEILRYITPYGVGCHHELDVSDYTSILQGNVEMRFNIGVITNGYIVKLHYDLNPGTPAHNYSWVNKIWHNTYPFGDYAVLQPVPGIYWNFLPGTAAAKLKITTTGHNWGTLNTGNAAEFYEATHVVRINHQNTFSQHLWVTCNPNPDGCSPQSGTWYYPRAGWCPGSIAKVFDYDLSPYVSQSNLLVEYRFDSTYLDLCHPNNPNCVTGVTCTDCNDPANPILVVSTNLISYGDAAFSGIKDQGTTDFILAPNPAHSLVVISWADPSMVRSSNVALFNAFGQLIQNFSWNGEKKIINTSSLGAGIYFIKVQNQNKTVVKKLIINN